MRRIECDRCGDDVPAADLGRIRVAADRGHIDLAACRWCRIDLDPNTDIDELDAPNAERDDV